MRFAHALPFLIAAVSIAVRVNGAVTYTFSATSDWYFEPNPQTFVFVSSNYIKPHTFVPADALNGCTAIGPCMGFFFTAPVVEDDPWDNIGFEADHPYWGDTVWYYYFPKGSLSHDGVFQALPYGNQPATLTITGTPDIPEPATWGSMILGFCGIGVMLRRHRSKARRVANDMTEIRRTHRLQPQF